MSGVGLGMQHKANKAEQTGRQATADLMTNRDARDREYYDSRAEEEERKRRGWLSRIFGR